MEAMRCAACGCTFRHPDSERCDCGGRLFPVEVEDSDEDDSDWDEVPY